MLAAIVTTASQTNVIRRVLFWRSFRHPFLAYASAWMNYAAILLVVCSNLLLTTTTTIIWSNNPQITLKPRAVPGACSLPISLSLSLTILQTICTQHRVIIVIILYSIHQPTIWIRHFVLFYCVTIYRISSVFHLIICMFVRYHLFNCAFNGFAPLLVIIHFICSFCIC